jgi:hypothetical protein
MQKRYPPVTGICRARHVTPLSVRQLGPRCGYTTKQPQGSSQKRHGNALTKDHPQYVGGPCANRDAYANLASPARNDVTGHPENAQDRNRPCGNTKRAHHDVQAAGSDFFQLTRGVCYLNTLASKQGNEVAGDPEVIDRPEDPWGAKRHWPQAEVKLTHSPNPSRITHSGHIACAKRRQATPGQAKRHMDVPRQTMLSLSRTFARAARSFMQRNPARSARMTSR